MMAPANHPQKRRPPLAIRVHESVNDIPFGAPQRDIQSRLGKPDQQQQNYTGEVEMVYEQTIYRCAGGRFVECTFPDRGRIQVDGVEIFAVFDWLSGCEDVVDMARFRISLARGLAYDYRNPDHGSITVFERGRWDALVAAGRSTNDRGPNRRGT